MHTKIMIVLYTYFAVYP